MPPIGDDITIRPARPYDGPALRALQALSLRVLARDCYSAAQIEAFLARVGSLDDFLLREGTYYLAEAGGRLAACGGWSRRRPNYAGAAGPAGLPAAAPDAPRIRGVFTHPDFARQGLARRLIVQAEAEAESAGHRRIELAATLSGLPLYRRLGYEQGQRLQLDLGEGLTMGLVSMVKTLGGAAGLRQFATG